MMNKLISKIKKLNNRGSSLVVVIIVIAFVCILGTLLLYLSVMNYQMKSNDYKTRVSFYGAEEPLEELKVQLAIDMSEACEKAYIDVMTNFNSLITDDLTVGSDMRASKYKEFVLDELETIWLTRNGGIGGGTVNWVNAIKYSLPVDKANPTAPNKPIYHVMDDSHTADNCGVSGCSCKYHIIVPDLGTDDRFVYDEIEGRAVLKDIIVVYTENDFVSVISTDFCMVVPDYNWDMQQSINNASSAHTNRQKIDYEKYVVYLNYTKQ